VAAQQHVAWLATPLRSHGCLDSGRGRSGIGGLSRAWRGLPEPPWCCGHEHRNRPFTFAIIAAVAELERELIRSALVPALKLLAARGGTPAGHPSYLISVVPRELRAQGKSIGAIGKALGVATATAHRGVTPVSKQPSKSATTADRVLCQPRNGREPYEFSRRAPSATISVEVEPSAAIPSADHRRVDDERPAEGHRVLAGRERRASRAASRPAHSLHGRSTAEAGGGREETRTQGAPPARHLGDPGHAASLVAEVGRAEVRQHRPARAEQTTAQCADVVELVLRMARENSSWGYTRIRGALANLGHEIGRNTIKRILLEAGMDPAPERSKRTSWNAFLRAHWGAIAAMDFFTVEVVTWAGLVRFPVLFAIDLASRKVAVAGIVHQPHEAWMMQIGRNLTDAVDGFLSKHRYLIMDRDPLFTHAFRTMLAASGVKSVRLPARSPNLNAFAERFVGSVRCDCLARVIPLGERHLRQLVIEYVDHYHAERNHQGLRNTLIAPMNNNAANSRSIVRRQRLGGLLNFYHREAA
jgi:putative transposase